MFMYTGNEGHIESRYRGALFLFRDGKAMLIYVTDGYISQGIGARNRDDALNKLLKAISAVSTGFFAGQHPDYSAQVFVNFMDEWPSSELVEEAIQSGALRVVPVSDLLTWSREARAAAE